MSACVHDSYDNELGPLNAKVDSERKPRHRRAPNITVHGGISQRMLREKRQSTERLIEEFASETWALPLVPASGFFQVSIRLFRESDRSIHSFFLISAITSSAGRLW